MVDGQVQLLDAEDLIARHADADVRDAGELGLFGSGQRDHAHALGAGDLGGLHDVGGVARRRDGEQHVSGLAVAVDLLGEDADGRLVVAESGGERRLRDERDGGQRPLEPRRGIRPVGLAVGLGERAVDRALEAEALHELADRVLGVGRRAAVAAHEQLAAGAEGPGDQVAGRADLRLADQHLGVIFEEGGQALIARLGALGIH